MFASFQKRIRPEGQSIDFQCTCGARKPIWNLFFCDTAQEFVCSECSVKEIDTFFSPSLLISTLSTSAFQDYNRCSKECDCPICGSTLQILFADEKYRFRCEFCRWDSAEIGLVTSDAMSLIRGVQKQEFPNREIFLQAVDALQKEHDDAKSSAMDSAVPDAEPVRPLPRRLSAPSAGPVARPSSRGVPKESILRIEERLEEERKKLYKLPPKTDAKRAPATPVDPIGPHTRDHDLTTVRQRLQHPGIQPRRVENLYPRRKELMTKIAHRCPKSRKYVVKPKIGASHVSFDKCLLAVRRVPRATIRAHSTEPPRVGATSRYTVFFKNPARSRVKMRLSPAGAADGAARVAVAATDVEISAFDDVEDIVQSAEGKTRVAQHGVIVYENLPKVGVPLTVTPTAAGPVRFALRIVLVPNPEKGVVSRLTFKEFTYTVHFTLADAQTAE